MWSTKPPQCLGLFRATFTCLDEITVPKICMAMVRTHLEYRNVILHPALKLIKQRQKKSKGEPQKVIQTWRHEPYKA